MTFGREALIEADLAFREKEADEIARAEADAAKVDYEEAYKRKTRRLAALLFQETVKPMGWQYNGHTFEPSKKKKHQVTFREQLALPGDFNLDRLFLRALGDQMSGWMNYTLGYHKDGENEDVSKFHISEYTPMGCTREGEWVTRIGIWEAGSTLRAVQFESQQYQFIKSVAGLFMPEVIKEYEKWQ